MRILYGVVGEGMGHATRSRVVLEHLLGRGHEVHVVVSGRAHAFLAERFKGRPGIDFHEIHGLALTYEGNALDRSESLWDNLEKAPAGILRNVETYAAVAEEGARPQLVISDFESWAYLYALYHRIPVVSIDNMQVINRCLHDEDVTGGDGFDFQLVKTAVKVKLPGAYHYLITSFFFPPVRKRRTTLVPPILRPQILAARREPGEHVLVYQTAASNQALVPALQRLDAWQFRVYGMGREGREGNVTLCAFSETGFVEDLRTARAVIAGGGFSLMSEAVHLHVPMLSVPVEKQFEQELNARYLAKLGYGAWARALDADTIARFLDNAGAHARALAAYEPRDNAMLVACVDELMRDVAIDEPAPDRLEAEAMGKWFGKPLDGEFADDV
jgi:uncharacterized protein (TIGR00661 family)